MKKIFILYLLAVSATISCIYDVSYEPKEVEDHIIINAQLQAGSGPHTIYAGVSKTKTVAHLSQAQIHCYVNGKYVCDAVEDEKHPNMQSPYTFQALLEPGDMLHIEVESEKGNVFSDAVVPYPNGKVHSIDYSEKGDDIGFTINIEDIGDGKDYYMLCCRHRYVRKVRIYISPNSYILREKSYSESIELAHTDDPILDGAYLGSANDERDILGTGIPNIYCIFSDERFTGTNASIKVSIPKEKALSTALDYEVYLDHDIVTTYHWLDFSICSISKEEYDYLAAINALKAFNFSSADLLEEAPVVPSNVSGGEGFVSISSCNWKTITITE